MTTDGTSLYDAIAHGAPFVKPAWMLEHEAEMEAKEAAQAAKQHARNAELVDAIRGEAQWSEIAMALVSKFDRDGSLSEEELDAAHGIWRECNL